MKRITNTFKFTAITLVVATSLVSCNQNKNNNTAIQTSTKALTSKEVQVFLDDTAQEIVDLSVSGARATWIYSNFITEDTASLAAKADQSSTEAGVRFAMQAAKFDKVTVSSTQRRQLNIIKQSLVLPAPQD